MPAIITHHLFGEDAVQLLPEGLVSTQEELLAFLIGNQGPDPLFARFSTLPSRARRCRELAHRMHEENVMATFWALRDGVSRLREEDKGIGRAWTLGFLGHYALDSTTHPLVYAQQYALMGAGTGLNDAGSEVHALLESELDIWMLRELRDLTVADVPTPSFLSRTDRIDLVAGTLMAQVALQVFGLGVAGAEYGAAINDYQLVYHVIDPLESAQVEAVASLERLVRPHSYLHALAHSVAPSETCAAANLDRQPWHDPATGAARTDSFPDLYHEALETFSRLVFDLSSGDRESFGRECSGRNYNGMFEAAADTTD